MSRTGLILLVIGLFVVGYATAQFFLPLDFHPDPDTNDGLKALVLWGGWGVGGVLALVGAIMRFSGMGTHRRASRQP